MAVVGLRALQLRIAMDGEAFIAAPGKAHAKDFQRVQETLGHRHIPARDLKGEEPAGTGEIALENGMVGMIRAGRVSNGPDL